MEVAVIDWKSIDSRFVKDELYEHINAPKWVDFSFPDDDPVDDEAWFCRPSCNHPKTVDDFFREKQRTPLSNSKLQRSASVSDIPPLSDRNKRDATLKKRGMNQPFVLSNKDVKYNHVLEDGENQDPNFATPPNQKARAWKDAIKSSAERKQKYNMMGKEHTPKLKSTLSARNLFSGGDLLNKVAEFCNELKKLAIKSRDTELTEHMNRKTEEKQETIGDVLVHSGYLNDKQRERKPLLELSKGKNEVMETSGSKGKLRRKRRNDDAENTPIPNDIENTPISVDVKSIKRQEAESLLQIRTCPPTPQGFSTSGGPLKPIPSKAFKSRPLEGGILQELKHHMNKEDNKSRHGGEVAEKEAGALDVFWFLKPCTLSS